MRADKGINNQRIVKCPSAFENRRERFLIRESRSVRPIRGERIEAIDYGQNSGAERDVGARYFRRIPFSIPVLMMLTHDWHDGVREFEGGEEGRAEVVMQ